MYRLEKIDLEEYRGDTYFLVGFVEPKPVEGEDFDPTTDADDYGVTLVQAADSQLEENQEIVRMDTAHGTPHMDLVYLPPDTDQERKQWLEDGYSYRRMKRYLSENWKQFVDLHIQHNE